MILSPEEQQQLITNYIEKAKKTEQDIPVLIEHQQFFAAVNRIYYGIFYMLSALAIKHHFSTSKHTQLIGWFNKTFVKDRKVDSKYTKYIQEAFEKRMKGDYEAIGNFSKSEVDDLLKKMKETLRAIEQLI